MQRITIDSSKKSLYSTHEVEAQVVPDVKVVDPVSFKGTFLLRVTNFKLIFQDSSSQTTPNHWKIQLFEVKSCEVEKTWFWQSPKLKLVLYNANPSESSINLELSSVLQAEQLNKSINRQLQRQSWLHYPTEQLDSEFEQTDSDKHDKQKTSLMTTTTKTEFSTSKAGISGITKTIEDSHMAVTSSLSSSFQDMDTLFKNALELVNLANRLTIKNQQHQAASSETPSAESNQDALQIDLIHFMGIRNPVTFQGFTKWDFYINELSIELNGFLIQYFDRKSKLNEQSISQNNSVNDSSKTPESLTSKSTLRIKTEVVSLIDLYCIFNRARFSTLVSPDDLYKAVENFEKQKLPCRLIKLADDTLAVCSPNYNEIKIAHQVKDIVSEYGSLSAFHLATLQHIGVPLSTHYLLFAESLGLLCRDESSEGLKFWPNKFLSPSN